jgi:hypothetical protein
VVAAGIALFDLDGVCVQPGGYRAAVRATVSYFLEKMGADILMPGAETHPMFESIGITSEWDMVPILLAIAIDASSHEIPSLKYVTTFEEVISILRQNHLRLDRVKVDYLASIANIAQYISGGRMAPSDLIIKARLNGGKDNLFPSLPDSVFQELFSGTREILNSQTTRLFQNYVLGDKAFTKTYQAPASIQGESFLKLYDHPMLSRTNLALVNNLKNTTNFHPAVLTARPSLPPPVLNANWHGYSPEAEMAYELVGFNRIPLIGYGRLMTLADLLGCDPDALVKPSPFQALFAIAAAWTGDEIAAMNWVEKLFNQWHYPQGLDGMQDLNTLRFPQEMMLYIFEDSPVGIQAGQSACTLLQDMGIKMNIKSWGIAEDVNKISALEKNGAAVFSNVNQAVEAAFKTNPVF